MGHREIALIICGCIIFVSITAIIIKYIYRHKKDKLDEKIKDDARKIQQLASKEEIIDKKD